MAFSISSCEHRAQAVPSSPAHVMLVCRPREHYIKRRYVAVLASSYIVFRRISFHFGRTATYLMYLNFFQADAIRNARDWTRLYAVDNWTLNWKKAKFTFSVIRSDDVFLIGWLYHAQPKRSSFDQSLPSSLEMK